MYLQPPEKCYPGCPGHTTVPKGLLGGMYCQCPCHKGGKCLGKGFEDWLKKVKDA